MTAPADSELTVAFRRLATSNDGDEWVLGRPDLGVFVEIPAAGAAFIHAVQNGATFAQAAERASAVAGEPVDGEDFVTQLHDAGLLAEAFPAGAAVEVAGQPRRREIHWIEGIRPAIARRFFGPTAWMCYAASAAISIGILSFRPDVRPNNGDYWVLRDPVRSLLIVIPMVILLTGGHEMWHWLAGRANDVPAAFRVSYRGVFLVFETDLSQILLLPRRRRYGAFLAGMAFDSAIVALALVVRLMDRLNVLHVPVIIDRLLALIVIIKILGLAWQVAGVFLRTDVYAILANALRCNDLNRTTVLTVRHRLGRYLPRPMRLGEPELAELEAAGPRDRAVARWFGIVYGAGIAVLTLVYVFLMLPALLRVLRFIVANLRSMSPGSVGFWESVGVVICLIATYIAPALLLLRERHMRAAGALR